MPSKRHIIATYVLASFCLWHITAITLYTLYSVPALHAEEANTQSSFFDLNPITFIQNVSYITQPYVLQFAQWQDWQLFSPNPILVSYEFSIEEKIGDTLHPLESFPTRTIHPYSTRLLENIATKNSLIPTYKQILQMYCTAHPRANSYIIQLKMYISNSTEIHTKLETKAEFTCTNHA